MGHGDQATVREALAEYLRTSDLPADGGYEDAFVRLKVGPIPLLLPNIPARRLAVRHHDVHHLVTGYGTTWTGEMEIGAWEVASGCAGFWVAWLLNLWALGMGLVVHPVRTFRAFYRGRRNRNTYRIPYADLLDRRVGELRAELLFDSGLFLPTWRDRLAYALWAGLGLLIALAGLAIPVIVLIMLVQWLW